MSATSSEHQQIATGGESPQITVSGRGLLVAALVVFGATVPVLAA